MGYHPRPLFDGGVILPAIRTVAQLAEQRSPKPQVGGSIPSCPAILLTIGYSKEVIRGH